MSGQPLMVSGQLMTADRFRAVLSRVAALQRGGETEATSPELANLNQVVNAIKTQSQQPPRPRRLSGSQQGRSFLVCFQRSRALTLFSVPQKDLLLPMVIRHQ